MAVDAKPIEVKSVREEERLFGGDIVWWVFLLVVSVPGVLLGLALAPQLIGFFILSVARWAGSVPFAQIALRLPFFPRRFLFSMLMVVVASAIIGGIAEI